MPSIDHEPSGLRAPCVYSSAGIAFETDRIMARGYSMQDADDALATCRDAEVMEFLGAAPVVADLSVQRAWLERVIYYGGEPLILFESRRSAL